MPWWGWFLTGFAVAVVAMLAWAFLTAAGMDAEITEELYE